jgi:anti-sigma B factor antagonist
LATYQQSQAPVQRHTFGTTAELVVQGELDIASSPDLRHEAEAAIRGGPERIVIDLREVTFMDSTGISALLRLRSHAIAHRVDMIVMRPNGEADRIFEICGIEGIFPNLDGTPARRGLNGAGPLAGSAGESLPPAVRMPPRT